MFKKNNNVMIKTIFNFFIFFLYFLPNVNASENCSCVYLDCQATTPCDPRVQKEMLVYLSKEFGNAHSNTHSYGWKAREAIEIAREKVASIIDCNNQEIIFTSGATESNNLAIKGTIEACQQTCHIITVVTEHKCVLESCKSLEKKGHQVTYLPVKKNGLIDLELLKKSIRSNTKLVTIMAVNNEIGVIQPLKKIGLICKKNGIIFHVDAAQGVGKIPISVKNSCIDLLSVSGHKFYAPKGIGALFIRNGVKIKPIMSGGAQEKGLRPGTLPVALCVALGKACDIAKIEMRQEIDRLTKFRDYLLSKLKKELTGVYLNGDLKHRIPGNLNITFDNVDGKKLKLALMQKLAVSSGSACNSTSQKPSHVLSAIGLNCKQSESTIRIGLGRFTTTEEIQFAANQIINCVKKLQANKTI